MTSTEESDATRTRKPTILIVEDNDQIRGLLCDILELSVEIIETMACPEASQLCAPHLECATQT